MTAAYSLLSKVYQTLRSDERLKAVVGESISVGLKRPDGTQNPALMLAIRTASEGIVTTLTDAFIDFVARSQSQDGEDTELAKIFNRADELVNGVHFQTECSSGKFTRRGLVVGFGTFDEQEQDYFKRWTYRVKVKQF